MNSQGSIKTEPEEGEINYLDIARSLITPSLASFWQGQQSTNRNGDKTVNESHPTPSRVHDPSSKTSNSYQARSRQGASSPAAQTLQGQHSHNSSSVHSQSDRAALLRAQLIEARKQGTPDSNQVKDIPTRPALPQKSPKDQSTTAAKPSSKKVTSADIDALINTESITKTNGEVSNGNSKQLVGGPNSLLRKDHASQENSSVPSALSAHRSSSIQRPSSSSRNSESSRLLKDSYGKGSAVAASTSSKYENAERERDMREKAAADYKERNGIASTSLYPSQSDSRMVEKNSSDKTEKSTGDSAKILDTSSLPSEYQDWLALTNWHNEEYRKKALDNYRKKLALQQQLRELDQSDLELRSSLTAGQLLAPAALSLATIGSPAPSTNKITTEPSPHSKDSPISVKRHRDDDKDQEREAKKLTKTETRPPAVERRSPKPMPPERRSSFDFDRDRDRDRVRRMSPPPSREWLHPGAPDSFRSLSHVDRDRGRYDEYPGRYEDRPYRPGYDERGREPSRERDPPPFKYEDEEAAARRRTYQGYPIVPCRYFKEGKCYKGSSCTYLHERIES